MATFGHRPSLDTKKKAVELVARLKRETLINADKCRRFFTFFKEKTPERKTAFRILKQFKIINQKLGEFSKGFMFQQLEEFHEYLEEQTLKVIELREPLTKKNCAPRIKLDSLKSQVTKIAWHFGRVRYRILEIAKMVTGKEDFQFEKKCKANRESKIPCGPECTMLRKNPPRFQYDFDVE